jgi:hypothetical protein
MQSAPRRAFGTVDSTQPKFLSKAARRLVRQAAALSNELGLRSFEASGIVWTLRQSDQRPHDPQQQQPQETPQVLPSSGQHTAKTMSRRQQRSARRAQLNHRVQAFRLRAAFTRWRCSQSTVPAPSSQLAMAQTVAQAPSPSPQLPLPTTTSPPDPSPHQLGPQQAMDDERASKRAHESPDGSSKAPAKDPRLGLAPRELALPAPPPSLPPSPPSASGEPPPSPSPSSASPLPPSTTEVPPLDAKSRPSREANGPSTLLCIGTDCGRRFPWLYNPEAQLCRMCHHKAAAALARRVVCSGPCSACGGLDVTAYLRCEVCPSL